MGLPRALPNIEVISRVNIYIKLSKLKSHDVFLNATKKKLSKKPSNEPKNKTPNNPKATKGSNSIV